MKDLHMKEKLVKYLPHFYVVIYPLLVYLTFEILNTNSETFANPGIVSNLPVVFLSSLAILLIIMIVFSLTGNIFVSGVLVTVFIGFFYVLSYYWLCLKGWVFSPSEIGLISQSKGIVKFSDISIFPIMYPTALLLIAEMTLLFFASKGIKLDLRKRMVCLNIYLGGVLFLFCTSFSTDNILPMFNINIRSKEPINQTYRNNGVLLGFYTSYFNTKNEAYADYDKTMYTTLLSSIEKVEPVKKAEKAEKAPEVKPNVIVIMSESYTDATLFPNITYSGEVSSNLHRLQESAMSGSILTPVFGGSTCNPEFEFLTGNAMVFAGYGVMPYENEDFFIPTNDARSLPQMFKNNGYKTVSVHPFKQDFFNRKSIHPKLGFEKSIFLEDMVDPPIKGEFVSDEYFTDTILNVIDDTDVPLFLYGISMQNHYYYNPGKYEEYDVTCQTDRLNEFQLGSVDAYIQGAYDADKQLGRLIDELSKSGRPTIVVFFGDHLPLLGKTAFEVYDALDYVDGIDMTEWNEEDRHRIFTTPYIVWNNYGLEKEDWGTVSPYFLGALVAEQAGIELNAYYDFLLQAYDKFHGMTEYLFVDADNNVSLQPTDEAGDVLEKFKAIQDDKLFLDQIMDRDLSRPSGAGLRSE